jgi:outer membrane immunogenic protein
MKTLETKKMKKILLGTVALVALGMSTSAYAADLRGRTYTKAPPPPPAPIYNWTGFYLGAHIGAAFGNDTIFGNSDARFMGGGQIGADYQFGPNWVAGIEGQYSAVAGNNNGLFKEQGLASVTGRLGWTWGPGLLYVKGGYAYQDRSNNLGVISTADRDGYTVGAGLEYMFAPNWSAKVEYQYYDFGRYNFVRTVPAPAIAGSFNNDEHTVKLGVNYRFGWGGPVVAKY